MRKVIITIEIPLSDGEIIHRAYDAGFPAESETEEYSLEQAAIDIAFDDLCSSGNFLTTFETK